MFIDEDVPDIQHPNSLPRREIITMVNSLRNKVSDSKSKDSSHFKTVFINTKIAGSNSRDSIDVHIERTGDSKGNHIYQYLYGVDSLQDSLKIPDIANAFLNKT